MFNNHHQFSCSQVMKGILSLESGQLSKKTLELGKWKSTYEITKKDVLTQKVSVNIPLQRFLSGLMPSFNAFTDEFAGSLKRRLENLGDVYHVIDPVITAVATFATIGAGMWRLNGVPVMGLEFLYHNFHFCPSLKRHDLVMLQVEFPLLRFT